MKNYYYLTISFLVIVCASFLPSVSGSKILLAAPFEGSKSHQNMYIPLAKELVKRGHHLTAILSYDSSDLKPSENLHKIVLPELMVDTSLFSNYFDQLLNPKLFDWESLVNMGSLALNLPTKVAETTFNHPDVRQMIDNEQFDLVLVPTFCPVGYAFAWHFKAPMIMISPGPLIPGMASILGDDENYSYVPFIMSTFTDRMNFIERTINTITTKVFQFFYVNFQQAAFLSAVRSIRFPNCPPFHEIEMNTSLIFINSHPVFNYPRTLAPQVIEMGGSQCRPAKPLESELDNFVNSSKDGFIIFSLGSYLLMDDMPEEMLQSFIRTFSKLPQKVIWQWKGKPRSDFPKNILPISWLPQQDLMGHKNCRLFMTHGGLNGMQEAIYHGVPLLGFPVYGDQSLNILRAVKDGYGLKLEWKDVTEESLTESINALLHNSSYTKVVKRLSNLFRDQRETPLERAVYWTEFVLRHDGAEHLRLGSRELAPFQRNLIDVSLFLLLTATVTTVLTILLVRKCCCSRKRASTTHSINKAQKKQN